MGLSMDLLVKLKGKKQMPRQWKHGILGRDRDPVQLCRGGGRKAKVYLTLNLAKDAKK